MSGDGVSLILALGSLVLVGSALAARRLPLADTVKLAAIWTAIFLAVMLGYAAWKGL